VQERDAPAQREPLEWKLITNLPVSCPADAVEKIDWYAMRWKIETFHKILKSRQPNRFRCCRHCVMQMRQYSRQAGRGRA
jgi:hypothetical protein